MREHDFLTQMMKAALGKGAHQTSGGGPYVHSFQPEATREPTADEMKAFDEMMADLAAQAEEVGE